MRISDWSSDVCSSDLTRQGEVLAHDPPGSLGVGEGLGQMGEVLTHEGHICGFDGHVTAHGTHGDADLSSGQRRRIVDAVAHHGGDRKSTRLNSSHKYGTSMTYSA